MIHFSTIFCLLACFHTAFGQDRNMLSLPDSSVVKQIQLPGQLTGDSKDPDASVVYIVSSNDIYNLFGYDTMMRYCHFDFDTYHILGERKGDHRQSAYSNDSNKEWTWTIRKNDRAFTSIELKDSPLSKSDRFKNIDYPVYKDTLLMPVSMSDSGVIRWYTTGYGDCMGWFTYALYKDNFHPVVLLKEWSHYGGCRAAGSRRTLLCFPAIPGVRFYRKNTILVARE